MPDSARRFRSTAERRPGGGISIALPFNPAQVWGERSRYHITGTVGGIKVRGPLERSYGRFELRLGPAWLRDCPLDLDKPVDVELSPEGPQQEGLAEDLAQALDTAPAARDFFSSLPTFYRKAYLTWIDGTKRRPDERARRIAELIELLSAGKKER
jgi:hypothetical protein